MRMRQPGRAGIFMFIVRALPPTGALSGAIFVSDYPDLCYAALDSQKAASAAGSEASMDCGTAPAKQGRSILMARRCCGACLHVPARRRRPPRRDLERKAVRDVTTKPSVRGEGVDEGGGRARRMFPPGLLPVRIGDKSLKGLDSRKEARFGFRSAGFGFRSRRTLILFRLVLISFLRILNSFHASWRLERSAAWVRFGVVACRFP